MAQLRVQIKVMVVLKVYGLAQVPLEQSWSQILVHIPCLGVF